MQNVKNDIFKFSEDEEECQLQLSQERDLDILNKSKKTKEKNLNKLLNQNRHGKSNMPPSSFILNKQESNNEFITVNYREVIEEKINLIGDLKKKINFEISKIVLCPMCKRKFANKAHYLRHTNLSELHKKNSLRFNNI